jgi:hypothetical protein
MTREEMNRLERRLSDYIRAEIQAGGPGGTYHEMHPAVLTQDALDVIQDLRRTLGHRPSGVGPGLLADARRETPQRPPEDGGAAMAATVAGIAVAMNQADSAPAPSAPDPAPDFSGGGGESGGGGASGSFGTDP